MKSNLIGLLLLIFPLILQAQINEGLAGQENLNALGGQGDMMARTFDLRKGGIIGHPFLINKWEVSDLKTKIGEFKRVAIKYDIYNDQIIFLKPKNLDSAIVNKTLVMNFTLLDQENRRFKNLVFKGKLQIYEVLVAGEVSLLKKWKKQFNQREVPKDSYSSNAPSEFILKTSLFISKGEEEPVRILNKKKLLEYLGNPALDSFVKAEKLNLKREKDLIRCIEEFNRIK